MSKAIGSICHLELFANNLDQSCDFYGTLFGWKFRDHDAGYKMWEDQDGLRGGFTTAGSPVTNSAATVYIHVDDIPGMLDRICGEGGTIIREKTAIHGDNGFFGLFRDPAGNNIGLWSAK